MDRIREADFVARDSARAGTFRTITERETGGITQSVGAYEISRNGRKMTFIDTPGHAAFMAMRSRGALAADVAILVVASDDGVAEQTKEAIRILHETKTPHVVAFTKIDRAPDMEKAKAQLMNAGVLLEGSGGDVSHCGVSAKTGDGIGELLDIVELAADVLNLECDADVPAEGMIIEAKKDARRGVVAHAIVTNGTLKPGDDIACGSFGAHIRSLEDATGAQIAAAVPSMPVAVLGFKEMPFAGERFRAGEPSPAVVLEEDEQPIVRRGPSAAEDDITVVTLVVKADSQGGAEAVSQIIASLAVPQGLRLTVAQSGVGEVTDGDIRWLMARNKGNAVVLGFNVSVTKAAENLAKAGKIEIASSKVIYDLVSHAESLIKKLSKATVAGDLEVLALFGTKGEAGRIVGGKVITGVMHSGAAVDVEREGAVVGSGTMTSLQSGKKPMESVEAGSECGMVIDGAGDIRVGDHVIIR